MDGARQAAMTGLADPVHQNPTLEAINVVERHDTDGNDMIIGGEGDDCLLDGACDDRLEGGYGVDIHQLGTEIGAANFLRGASADAKTIHTNQDPGSA